MKGNNKLAKLIKSMQQSKGEVKKKGNITVKNRKVDNHRNGPCLIQVFQNER